MIPTTFFDEATTQEQEKALALAMHLHIEPVDGDDLDSFLAQINNLDGDRFEYQKEEYLVLTDSEAEKAWDESLENYIEECILPELPKEYGFYFDDEKWKQDAKFDGRGNSLATYDSQEHDQTVNGTDYYIYRTN